MLGLANGVVEPVPVVVIILPTCLLVAFESSARRGLLLSLQLLTISIIVVSLHRGDRIVHRQILVLRG